MIFFTIITAISEPIVLIKQKTKQILVINIFDLQSSNWKKQVCKVILNKNRCKNRFEFLINILREFLPADLVKKDNQ